MLRKKYNDKKVDKNGRAIICLIKDCNEPAFEFCLCIKHADEKAKEPDDLPTHNNYLLT